MTRQEDDYEAPETEEEWDYDFDNKLEQARKDAAREHELEFEQSIIDDNQEEIRRWIDGKKNRNNRTN
jgi:hypothetical protein